MRTFSSILTVSLLCLALGSSAAAQEGHPVKGSWLGTWGPSETHENDVIVVMDWNGEEITGVINPGTDNIQIQNATLDPNGWVVRFEAQGRDRAGNALNYVVEGRIENLAFYNRSIVGTWRHQSGSGPFRITRQ